MKGRENIKVGIRPMDWILAYAREVKIDKMSGSELVFQKKDFFKIKRYDRFSQFLFLKKDRVSFFLI